MKIVLPYKYTPREYQLPFWRAMVGPGNPNGKRRAYLLRHRRAGKDKDAFNYMVRQAFERIGVYYYFFPSYAQGRKALWDNVDRDGMKFLDHIPKDLMAQPPNQTEMKVFLKNGSLIQVVGSDNIDTVVGSNPVGVVFSEYSLQDPSGYNFVRPILRENGGWAVFTLTPRGSNHAKDLYDIAKNNEEWYVEKLTIDDTWPKGGTVSPAHVEEERQSGMSESLIQQEFFCFPAGTMIWTATGQVPIENVRLGDTVLTHAGRWRKVTRLMQRETTDRLVSIESFGSCKPLVCTENHPVRVCKPSDQTYEWKTAGEVKPGEYVVLPRLKMQDAKVISASLAYILGWFIAEGSVARTAVNFTLNVKERDVVEKLIAECSAFGKAVEFKSKDSNATNVVVNSAWLADFLTTACGSSALSKRIPWALIAGHEELVYEALIDGDGCRGNYSGISEVFTTISYGLALDVQMLAHMLGKRASVTRADGKVVTFPHGKTYQCNDSYSVRISTIRKPPKGRPRILPQKHGVAAEVRAVKHLPEATTKVYNFSVQYDESYVAEGRVVHNCSFDAAVEHAVFGKQFMQARSEGRITTVPYQKGLLVNTYWDIGRDTTAIWFEQSLRNEVRLIDYHQAVHSTLDQEIAVLQDRGYVYGVHYMPHDADYKDYKTGTTPKEVATELGLNVEVLPKTYEHAHIDAARMLFNRCWFDEKKCEQGLAALQNWSYVWDEKTRALSRSPEHNWSSHGGKSFCYLAIGHEDEIEWRKPDRYARKNKKTRSWMTA